MTGQEQSVEVQLLAETKRLRKAAESIQTLLTIMFIVGFLGAIIWFGISLSR